MDNNHRLCLQFIWTRVFYQCIVLVGTKQNPDRRVFVGSFLIAVVVIYIHLQLPNILVRNLMSFQFDNDETAKQSVVEYQIGEKFVVFKLDAFCRATNENPLPNSNRNA